KNTYIDGTVKKESFDKSIKKGRLFKTAWEQAMTAVNDSASLFTNCWSNFTSGLFMTMAVIPSLMSFGLLGMILVAHPLVFDFAVYILYPFTSLLPESLLAAKSILVGFASTPMISVTLVAQASVYTKFTIGIFFVSSILFFSEVIPVIWSTSIPISTGK